MALGLGGRRIRIRRSVRVKLRVRVRANTRDSLGSRPFSNSKYYEKKIPVIYLWVRVRVRVRVNVMG